MYSLEYIEAEAWYAIFAIFILALLLNVQYLFPSH